MALRRRHRFVVAAMAGLLTAGFVASGSSAADEDTGSILIRGAALVHPGSGDIAADQCLWIRGERIERISPCTPRDSADRVIEAGDKWIIPGLWDMHVHAVWDTTAYRDFFEDFVAYGVVGVRDMGGTAEALVAARKFLAGADNIAPDLVAAGQVIDGAPPLQPLISVIATNFAEGVQAVAQLDSLGADFIKIYTTLPREAAEGVFHAARARDLEVVGHVPADIGVAGVWQSGMASIEHMAVEIGGLCDVADRQGCLQTFRELNAAGTYLTPTLLVRQRPGTMRDPQTMRRARMTAMPPVLAAEWQANIDRILREQPDSYFDDKSAQYDRERALTEIAIEAGALILVGTDSGDFLVPPGSSIHEELELLVEAGMQEQDALYAASGRATDFLGLADRGHIREGAIADLVILEGNPLDDIKNTRRISAVVRKGHLLDRRRLDCMRSREPCD